MKNKPCYLKMSTENYGLMYYPEEEVKWDLFFSKRPHIHPGYEITEPTEEIQKILDNMIQKYKEKWD